MLGLAPVLRLGLQLQGHQMLSVTLLLHTLVQALHLGQAQGAMLGHVHCWDELMCWWPQWWCIASLWFQGDLSFDPCVLAGAERAPNP